MIVGPIVNVFKGLQRGRKLTLTNLTLGISIVVPQLVLNLNEIFEWQIAKALINSLISDLHFDFSRKVWRKGNCVSTRYLMKYIFDQYYGPRMTKPDRLDPDL